MRDCAAVGLMLPDRTPEAKVDTREDVCLGDELPPPEGLFAIYPRPTALPNKAVGALAEWSMAAS